MKKKSAEKKSGTLSLAFVWKMRLSLRAEGSKLWAEGNKLWAEGVLETYGNITLLWECVAGKNGSACILETGERFEP